MWLFVGVNGVGKTTTIGKVAAQQVADGHRVVLAAGDTFRAAAAEQLQTWAGRAGADFVRGNEGGDPSAVIFDAVQRAAARDLDLVLGDTAGRLHTKTNLMEELRKVRRVAAREPGHVSEVLLVVDATTGQNGLNQARQFTEATDVTGVVLTKLDGSAKGGIVFAIQTELGIPVKLVGVGEGIADLVPFDADEFVEALFEELRNHGAFGAVEAGDRGRGDASTSDTETGGRARRRPPRPGRVGRLGGLWLLGARVWLGGARVWLGGARVWLGGAGRRHPIWLGGARGAHLGYLGYLDRTPCAERRRGNGRREAGPRPAARGHAGARPPRPRRARGHVALRSSPRPRRSNRARPRPRFRAGRPPPAQQRRLARRYERRAAAPDPR